MEELPPSPPVAPLVERSDWHAELPVLSPCPSGESAGRAEHWAGLALRAHATVAWYQRFVLQLMALGTPPEHLRSALRASREQVDLARRAFAIASVYGGKSVGPGKLEGASRVSLRVALVARECYAEAYHRANAEALRCTVAAHDAQDPPLRETLSLFAAEHARRAEEAARALAWLRFHPRHGAEARAALDALPELTALTAQA